ncbi:MAG: DUF4081 domain-containing protein [Candidatus Nanopelagicales bacterium]
MPSPVQRPAASVRVLGPEDTDALRSLMRRDAVRHCFAEARLDAWGLHAAAAGGPFWGYGESGRVESALLVGANMVPVETSGPARAAFAAHALRQGRRSSSIVGPADEVLDLWRHLEPHWGPAREVRPDQLLMVATVPPQVDPDPDVRVTVLDDLPGLFPACVAMFTEEVGVSPIAGGMEPAYRRRVADLIRTRRSYAAFDGDEPVFKAEVGALSGRAGQIQGVWVPPERRREGRASRGMAAVVALAAELTEVLSLYVNSYNTGAVRAYEAAGFRTVGRFATILF